eukprot:scaffold23947_cov28-Tisochrysis_lutea.AAC.2
MLRRDLSECPLRAACFCGVEEVNRSFCCDLARAEETLASLRPLERGWLSLSKTLWRLSLSAWLGDVHLDSAGCTAGVTSGATRICVVPSVPLSSEVHGGDTGPVNSGGVIATGGESWNLTC